MHLRRLNEILRIRLSQFFIRSFLMDIQKLRQHYLDNPPDGMTKKQIQNMSDDDLLDMDYFLNEDEDDIFNDED